jgi:hypothetical protein
MEKIHERAILSENSTIQKSSADGRENMDFVELQLKRTNTAFHSVSELKDELSLIKDRLELCELKNQDFELRF